MKAKYKYESHELFLLFYVAVIPSQMPIHSLVSEYIGLLFTCSQKSPSFPVLKEQKVSQSMGNRAMTNSMECLKLKLLFAFEVHVYLYGNLKHIGSV